MKVVDKVQESIGLMSALGVAGFIGIVWLMIYGFLSGNLGFAVGTQGYNNTQTVIDNMTSGFTVFFGFAPTWFQIAAIVLLIVMLVGLLGVVIGIMNIKKGGSSSGYA